MVELSGKTVQQAWEEGYKMGRFAAAQPLIAAPALAPTSQRVLPLAQTIPQALARIGHPIAVPAPVQSNLPIPIAAAPIPAPTTPITVPTNPITVPANPIAVPANPIAATNPIAVANNPIAAANNPIAGPVGEKRSALSPAELESGLLYWLDLITDECRSECVEMARAIANDMNIKFAIWKDRGQPIRQVPPFPQLPNTMNEFAAAISRIPAGELEAYLIDYNVVPSGKEPASLLEQLQKLESIGSIDQFEKYDQEAKVMRPPTAPSEVKI